MKPLPYIIGIVIAVGCSQKEESPPVYKRTADVRCPTSAVVAERAPLSASSTGDVRDHVWTCGGTGMALTLRTVDGVERTGTGAVTVTVSVPPKGSNLSEVDLRSATAGVVSCEVAIGDERGGCSVQITPPLTDGGTGASCQPLTSFAGAWHSEFVCTQDGGSNFSGAFDLDVTQTGDRAQYTDGNTVFTGTVCGSVWSFTATTPLDGGGFETETGTVTLESASVAKRKSDWSTPQSAGSCTDTWTRR